jgi:hypothetical protein
VYPRGPYSAAIALRENSPFSLAFSITGRGPRFFRSFFGVKNQKIGEQKQATPRLFI